MVKILKNFESKKKIIENCVEADKILLTVSLSMELICANE